MKAHKSFLNFMYAEVNLSILQQETVYSNILLTLVTIIFYWFLSDKI